MSRIKTLLLALFLTSCASSDNDDDASLKIALVDAVDGNPYVLRENRLIQLTVRSALDLEDTVITGPEDRVRFEFEDGTRVAAGHSAQLRIESFNKKLRKIHLSSSDGAYLVELSKAMGKKDASFRLSTPFGNVAASDGTRFWFQHSPAGSHLEVVLLAAGELRVRNDFGETVLNNIDEGCTVAFSSAPSEARVLADMDSRTSLALGD